MYDRISKLTVNMLSHAIASSTTSPNDTAPLAIETLHKSGIEGLSNSRNDEGIPLVDIREDLDDDGNVICMTEYQSEPPIS